MKALLPALLLLALAPPAQAEPNQPTYADAIRETVYVESAIDGDGDGRRDRIVTDIIRPRTAHKVPVLMGMSPYNAPDKPTVLSTDVLRPGDGWIKDLEDDGHPDFFPYMYDNYFVPRGYAVVVADMPGTRFSEGCIDIGGPNEVQAAKAVIDWLGGRAKAYGRDGTEIKPEWTTGDVGMFGKSWDGTLANQVATTNVPNLKTIVPVAAISSWYDYTRVNGLRRFDDHPGMLAGGSLLRNEKCADELAELRKQADTTADYNAFWDRRNFVDDAWKVKASVFAIHGLNDTNVTVSHLAKWWENLRAPRKLWLAQTQHTSPQSFRPAEFLPTVHRWFDQWLKGVDTGIMREPAVEVERFPGVWEKDAVWPAPTKSRKINLGDYATGPQSFTDAPTLSQTELAGDASDGHRLRYITEPLAKDTRLSGTPSITLRVSADVPNTPISALLVDYGADTRSETEDSDLRPIPGKENCFGEGLAPDTGCYQAYERVTRAAPLHVVSRGTIDAAHRFSLSFAVPLEPGRTETITWRLQPQDYVFKQGHRIGIVIAGNNNVDWSHYRPTYPSGEITVSLRGSYVNLPLVP
ncbi:X-Pro dipeptidyl-peptidase [Lentzea sp. NBRC 105346]|uniref:CocE/NonD family hydrolase n=1 Tax=Lentzea sp. NBRC 105346 TaxID=3032205 RepID=UPI0024A416DD|nr:CocE/NonD family hydrolase [Lentzea sp. NBRC 105346]GLZ34377.1 X-Pro dipeptidyl-peptidase [Lentzea sp. NBRC 105346]